MSFILLFRFSVGKASVHIDFFLCYFINFIVLMHLTKKKKSFMPLESFDVVFLHCN